MNASIGQFQIPDKWSSIGGYIKNVRKDQVDTEFHTGSIVSEKNSESTDNVHRYFSIKL